jgi:hypothetical protein
MGKGGKGEKVSDGKRVKVKGGKREGLRVVERGKGEKVRDGEKEGKDKGGKTLQSSSHP